MAGAVQELRMTFRRLRRAPGFTLVAGLTVALAIAANAALFSLVEATLLRPLPFAAPERLYAVWSQHSSTPRYPFQLVELFDYRERARSLAGLAALGGWSANLAGDGPAERLVGSRVSGNLYELLGAPAALGRTLRPDDDLPGRPKVVVMSHGLWQRRFGGDPGLVGRSVRLNGESYQVVGVLGADFSYPVRGVDVAVPLVPDADPWRHDRQATSFLRLIARARPDATPAQVERDLAAIATSLRAEFPEAYARKLGVTLVPLHAELTRTVADGLWMLQAAVGVLLLIACANLANLMLARGAERARELAIRRALGASAGALGRELLAESLVLSLVGGVAGLALAWAALPALVAASPTALPQHARLALNPALVLSTFAIALLVGAGFGLLPALRASCVDAGLALRTESRGSVGSARAGRTRGLLLTAQLALMVVLLSAAGLLWGSFRQVLAVEPGFDGEVLTARLALPRARYSALAEISSFYREVERRVAGLPGVTAVAAVNHVPLNGALASADYRVEGEPVADESALPTAQYRMATPDFFRAMGIPLVDGRAFTDEDREGSEPVAIVSRSLARQSFAGASPIGRHLRVKDTPAGFRPVRIVGVVGDLRHTSLETPPEPHLFVPYHQTPKPLLIWLAQTQFLVVRTQASPEALAESVRRAVDEADPGVASADLRTAGTYVAAAAGPRRFTLGLLLGLAALALGLAAVGLYGVAAHGVARRTRETGVRLALGARPRDVLVLVLGEGLRRAAVGLGLGLIGAALAARGLRGLLFGVEAGSPGVYATVVLVLAVVTLLAYAIPARRAAGLSPTAALRVD